jgi:hypothetical protein
MSSSASDCDSNASRKPAPSPAYWRAVHAMPQARRPNAREESTHRRRPARAAAAQALQVGALLVGLRLHLAQPAHAALEGKHGVAAELGVFTCIVG